PMASDIGGSYDKVNPEIRTRYGLIHQGESAERLASRWKISRADVDAYSAESHRRASLAARERLTREILPISCTTAHRTAVVLSRDEGIRDAVDLQKMAALPTVFRPGGDGVVTAGNSSQISDGASAILVGNREIALADGFRPRARFRARVVGGDD